MDNTEYDIIADVSFLPASEGGRRSATPSDWFSCILQKDDMNFDIHMYLQENGPIYPGQSARVPIRFLDSEFAMPRLSVGAEFYLRDYRMIGNGKVVKFFKKVPGVISD